MGYGGWGYQTKNASQSFDDECVASCPCRRMDACGLKLISCPVVLPSSLRWPVQVSGLHDTE